ncbi:MAG: hypothetical protein RQ754_15640, partial [Desulfuromonadales bacterium]|nr:hypothetical protein [Desulfuromonadales bacterium]
MRCKIFLSLLILLYVTSPAFSANGVYHAAQFMDDQVMMGTNGSIVTSRMELSFGLTATGDFTTVASSTGSTETGSFTYLQDPDNKIMVNGQDEGLLAAAEDIFLLGNTDPSDNTLMQMVGARKATAMDNQTLAGDFFAVELWEENAGGDPIIASSVLEISVGVSGTGSFAVMANTHGDTESGGFTYSLQADGSFTVNGDMHGFAAETGQMFVLSDTIYDGVDDTDVNLLVAIKKGAAMSNADLVGEFEFHEIGYDRWQGGGESFAARSRLIFFGNGSGLYEELSTSWDELSVAEPFSYAVQGDGTVLIDPDSYFAVSGDGNLFLNVSAGLDGESEFIGIGLKNNLLGDVTVSTDGDAIPDIWEEAFGLNTAAADGDLDSDNDGATNYQEFMAGTNPIDSDNDGIVDTEDNCPDTPNEDQGDANQDGLGDACDYVSDFDADGLSDAAEYHSVTDLYNPDTDGDTLLDGADTAPVDVRANFKYVTTYNETLADPADPSGQTLKQRVALVVGIEGLHRNGDFTTLGNLDVRLTGPGNFEYVFTDANLDQNQPYLDLYAVFNQLAEGLYTFTVTDVEGNSVSQARYQYQPDPVPVVDHTTLQWVMQPLEGTMRFSWAPVNDDKTYWYYLRITDENGNWVHATKQEMNAFADIPVQMLQNGATYYVQVRAQDGTGHGLGFDRSRSLSLPFVAGEGNVTKIIPEPKIYNLTTADGVQYVRLQLENLGKYLGVLPSNLVIAEVSGPNFYYEFDPAELIKPEDGGNYFILKDLQVDPQNPMEEGLYSFHLGMVNGDDYYGFDNLTVARPVPVPQSEGSTGVPTMTARTLANGDVRFQWYDGDYNGSLYYRGVIHNIDLGRTIESGEIREHTLSFDVPADAISFLGAGTLEAYLEVTDSPRWSTMRNRSYSELFPLVIEDYDPDAIPFDGVSFNTSKPDGSPASAFALCPAVPTDGLTNLDLQLAGPNDFTSDLQVEGVFRDVLGPCYSLRQDQHAEPGLYTFTASDINGQREHYNYQPTAYPIPRVDMASFNLDPLPNGDLRFSWAPVQSDLRLWYTVVVEQMVDDNNDEAPDQVHIDYNLESSFTTLPAGLFDPAEQYAVYVIARDGRNGLNSNNRSYSVKVGVELTGFDYSTLEDTDNDGWASNIDPDDGDASVYPFSSVSTTAVAPPSNLAFPSTSSTGNVYPS